MTQKQQDDDARKFRRFTVDVDASIMLSGATRIPARARDLSRTGICLIAAQGIERGQPLEVTLVLSFSNNAFSEPLRLRGRVVWCAAIAQSFQIGAMFEDVTEDQDGSLELFLHFLDGTLAPRGSDDPDGADDRLPGPDKDDYRS